MPSTASACSIGCGGAGRELRVEAVHRGLVRLAPRPEAARVVGRPRPQLDARARRRRARRRAAATPAANQSIAFRRAAGGFRPVARRGSVGAVDDDLRDPTVEAADVTEQIGDRPVAGTTAPRRRRPAARAASASAAPSATDRGDVLVVTPSAGIYRRGFEQLRAVVDGLVDEHRDRPALELVAGERHEQLLERRRRRGSRRRATCPTPTRGGSPASDRESARMRSFGSVVMIVHDRMRGASSPICAVVPDRPQARERERLAVAAPDEPRLALLAAFDRLPLVETVGGDDAPAPLERPLVRVARQRGPRRGR